MGKLTKSNMRAKDITGELFGRLTVQYKHSVNRQGNALWFCLCDCGNSAIVRGADLRNGHTNSCGCFNEEQTSKANTTHSGTVGGRTKEYRVWLSMRRRCFDASHEHYLYYGGRGVTVCDRWKDDFEAFLSDMGTAPFESSTIERINTNGNYEPTNCKWATKQEQVLNQNPKGFGKIPTHLLND